MSFEADLMLSTLIFLCSLLLVLLDERIRDYVKRKEPQLRTYFYKFSIVLLAYGCAISIAMFSSFQTRFAQVVSWPLLVAYAYTKLSFQAAAEDWQKERVVDAYFWLVAQGELSKKTLRYIELELARLDLDEKERNMLTAEKAIVRKQCEAVDVLISGYLSFRRLLDTQA